VSDRQPPGGPTGPVGPEEERPSALIPSRAARHQKQRGRLLRGRPSEPPGQQPPGQQPPRQQPPRQQPPPRQQRPRVRAVPHPPGRDPSGPPWEEPDGEPRRRPALKAPQLQVPKVGDLRGSSLGLAGALVAVAAVLVLGVNALPSAKPPAAPVTRDPYSARWVCPLLGGQTTAVTVANVGTAPAALRTTIREKGKTSAPKRQQLAAGATQQLSLKPAKEGFVQVEAFSAPVVVSAPGIGCAAGPGNRWWLPASDTRFGTDTKVIIANPESEPAVVDLVPHLTSGSIRSDDREVFIKPGEAQVRTLGDDAPAGLKPSIEVVARAGRVVVGAAVSSGDKPPTLLPAQGAAKPSWSFAGGLSGGGSQTQVLVTNPNATPLQVDVQVTTAKGTFRPPGEFGEPIANGGTAELDIPALDVKGPFAVQVRSLTGAAFVAALRVTEGNGNQTTSRIDLGTGQAERGWLVPGAPGGGELVLANLSSDELEARFGDLTAGGAGAGQPVRVPPGRLTVKKVPEGIENLVVQAATAGLVAAPRDGGPVVPGSAIGGLPAGGPVVPGPAAAP
jgi:hypothetical protein